MTQTEMKFLGKKMKELRLLDDDGQNLENWAKKLTNIGEEVYSKSTLSRAENGLSGEKTILKYAKAYCNVMGFNKQQIEQFLRANKIVIPDTSALLKNPQLIDELQEDYNKVVIVDIVLDELDKIKNKYSGSLGKRAWEIIRSIGYGDQVKKVNYNGDPNERNNDKKICYVGKIVSENYGCEVHIITDDADYSAFLKDEPNVSPLHLREYVLTKQNPVNMTKLIEFDNYYSDNYNEFESFTKDELNAYLPNGYTLIISTVRNKNHTTKERIEKIRWLVKNGADINKRDNKRRYFPPLSHAIQINNYDIFIFLLNECGANPNVGSRNPYDTEKVRQKNSGNMPLMIAAWDGRSDFIKALCTDRRTSLNQQDANGFTALIKACHWGYTKCRDILLEAGADTKIVDIDGKTAEDHYNEYLETGRKKEYYNNKKRNKQQ